MNYGQWYLVLFVFNRHMFVQMVCEGIGQQRSNVVDDITLQLPLFPVHEIIGRLMLMGLRV